MNMSAARISLSPLGPLVVVPPVEVEQEAAGLRNQFMAGAGLELQLGVHAARP
jgi:hypothetical protein